MSIKKKRLLGGRTCILKDWVGCEETEKEDWRKAVEAV